MKFFQAVTPEEADVRRFGHVARAGEWAVPGTFHLWDLEPGRLRGKEWEAFAHGMLGIESLGWTGLVQVAEISNEEVSAVTHGLCERLMARYGAPDREAARPVAEEEIRLTLGLCEHPEGTLVAVDREASPEGILENYRVVAHPGAPLTPWDPTRS